MKYSISREDAIPVVVPTMALAFFLALAPAWGHDEGHGGKEPKFGLAELYEPTPAPDRIVLTWSDEPTTTVDVTWRTDESVTKSQVEYKRADLLRGNLRSGDVPNPNRISGTGQRFMSTAGPSTMHSVKLDGLEPGTMYAYRVGSEEFWSEWFQFRTASASPEAFTFVYFGDAQNAIRSMWSRVIREANQHAPRAAFMLHAGDLVNHENTDSEWGEWFSAGGWLNGMIPVVATPGNHEYGDELSRHWRPQFAFPLNGPPGLEETVYYFDYQGARIVSLNSNELVEPQTEWLTGVLQQENRPKWTIVTFHHPIFSAAKDRDNPGLRALWRPVFEEYGVDLVLQGHDHAYNRSGLGGPKNSDNVPEGVRRKDSNTVYVVSVSGPKMYGLQEQWKVSRVAGGVQLFQVIRVAPDSIRYEARTAEGTPYDAFTLTKTPDGKSTLKEEVPAGAEIIETE